MIQYENDMNPALCNVKPSGIRKFFSIAEEMDNVISLGVGEPDFLTPWHIRREGIDSLDRGATRYTPTPGCCPCGRRSVPSTPAGIICSTELKIRCW